MRIFSLLLLSILSIKSYSQNNDLYIFENRYKDSLEELNKKASFDLKSIKILGQYMIDPSRKGVVRYDVIDTYIDRLYPNKNVSGILCINIEGKLFKELRDNKPNSKRFKNALEEYVKLVKYVKKKLPNVRVGIYGLPFNGYYESQLRKNDNEKLDPLLKHVDVLFPSLYIAYPEKQKGKEINFEYLKNTLDISFKYGTRLNRPVFPFFWYLIHPANKKYGSAFIPKNELYAYLNYINSYKFKGKSVGGVVWWDTPTPYNNKNIKYNLLDKNLKIENLDEAFYYYVLK